jgi:hypothetical protein
MLTWVKKRGIFWRNIMAKSFSVTVENGSYLVQFPYDPTAVDMLKRYIPSTGRSWDNTRKAWIIAAQFKKEAENALGMTFPVIAQKAAVKETRLLEVRYLGACKERAPGEVSAMGLLKSGVWGVVFPVNSLTAWFEDPGEVKASGGGKIFTLYAILGAHQSDDEQAIKTAYRRMAKQWHPDVCREPGANARFLRIREAYDILSNPRSKGRYDAGLAFEATIEKTSSKNDRIFDDIALYRSPLRCGWILAEGVESIGRFVVSAIISWDDITDGQGRSLVSSWKMGDKSPTEVWA